MRLGPAARRCLAVLAGSLVLGGVATPAVAAETDRAGWWNAVSAGGLALPAPTTADGDLRIAAGADGPTAYAAVLLTAAGSRSATLDLLVRPGSALGTPEVVACPTATVDWPEGGNQPIEAAPAYDCELGLSFGALSEDGTTLSFVLDDATQAEIGTWSLALVPPPGSTASPGPAPFALDLQPPGPQAFTPAPPDEEPSESAEPQPDGPGSVEQGPPVPFFDEPVGDSLLLPAADPVPFDTGPFDAGTAATPLLAEAAPPPSTPAAGPTPAFASPGLAPRSVLTRPVAQPLAGVETERLLALLLLVGISAAVGYAAGKERPGPRLIGGRAGTVPAVPAAPMAPAAGTQRERGIGRFAKPREAAPRRLR